MGNKSEYLHKRHNVSVLLYHYVCPAKYRRVVISEEVDRTIKYICEEIEKRFDIIFLEVGTDKDHVHFLIQASPNKSPTQIIKAVKSIVAREVFMQHPEVKKALWGGEFWSDGYYAATVGQHGNERYVKEQGQEKEYKQLTCKQLSLFDE